MNLKIKITRKVLIKSMFCRDVNLRHECAIAVAIKKIFPNSEVRESWIRIGDYRMELPLKAKQFMSDFDWSFFVLRPFLSTLDFDVEIPQELIDEIGINEVNEILSKSSTLERCTV